VVWPGWYGVYGRLFDASGTTKEAFLVIGDYGPFDGSDVAMAAGGEFAVAWASSGITSNVRVRRYDRSARLVGDAMPGFVRGKSPAVAMRDDGGMVVVWVAGRAIRGRRLNRHGAAVGATLLVSTNSSSRKQRPDVAMASDGTFVVVWQSAGQDGDGEGIFSQRFDSAGRRLGREVRVNTRVENDQVDPAVAIDDAGGFFVAWTDQGHSGTGEGIFGQLFDGAGGRVGGERRLNGLGNGARREPSVAMAKSGAVLTVWRETSAQDGSSDVFGRWLAPVPSDRDRDGVVDGIDNCPTLQNPDQADAQGDGLGDACVAPDVLLPPDLRLGANPRIGSGTTIGGAVTLGSDASIGESVRLDSQVRAGDRLVVDDLVAIGPASTAGNDVSIGLATRVEGGVRIGNAVRIGERVAILRNAVVEARVTIGPSALISTGARIGAGATIEMGATVGSRAVVRPGALVAAGTTVPARSTFP
jgi:carbonic anhydrase/acetyltransferase-like protein (isoleucine patch superfamily)